MRFLLLVFMLVALSGCSMGPMGPRKMGYIDENGTFITKPNLLGATDFSEGLAVVTNADGDAQLIDKAGQLVRPLNDMTVTGPFSEGLIRAWDHKANATGYIDHKGAFAIRPQYAFSGAEPFKEGLAHVKNRYSGIEGFINHQGKLVITLANSASFSEGLAAFYKADPDYKRNGLFRTGYIDKAGKVVIQPKWTGVFKGSAESNPFLYGRARVQSNKKYGFIDRAGRLVIPTVYDTAEDFSEGLALVCQKRACWFIDTTGKAIIKLKGQGKSFSDGLAAVSVSENKWGFIDKTGKTVIPPIFYGVEPFSEGRAAFASLKSGSLSSYRIWRYGYINRAGKVVVPARFESVSPFRDGRAAVCVENCEYHD